MTRTAAFVPQPGPQTELLTWMIPDVLFGGARGGGKTMTMLGEWIQHDADHGSHARGLVIRRTRVQLAQMIETALQLYLPMGAKYNGTTHEFMFPSGSRLTFSYLESNTDAENFQGQAFCVGVDTPIVMADGSRKAISAIAVGDRVLTLEGPKRVLSTVPPYLAPCVRTTVFSESGARLGSQVQPTWHPILTTDEAPYALRRGWFRTDERLRTSCQIWRSYIHLLDARRGNAAASVSPGDGRIGCRASEGEPPVMVLLVPQSDLAARGAPDRLSDDISSQTSTRCHDHDRFEPPVSATDEATASWFSHLARLFGQVRRALDRRLPSRFGAARRGVPASDLSALRKALNSQADYLLDAHFYDGPLLPVSASAQCFAPQPDDAEQLGRADCLSDETGCIRAHSHAPASGYIHPYTKEPRGRVLPLISGTLSMVPCGHAYVTDLHVEDANHYISATGIINKNTRIYVEEITNFPDPAPLDRLKATLRSAHGVPCYFRATGNPGGSGHSWVRARYIDPCPKGRHVIRDEETGMHRAFLPSLVGDNPILLENDPGYVDRLKATGSPALVRAWLDGDWDAVQGAFLEGVWVPERHIVEPFTIPLSWTRWRAMDWGFARPYAIGWYAMDHDGVVYMYRELYGTTGQPNVGSREDARVVARRVVDIEEAETDRGVKFDRSPADRAIWSKIGAEHSIAENFFNEGVYFVKSDSSPGSRVNGAQEVVARLNEGSFKVFTNCRHWLRTVPVIMADEKNPDDVDTEQEDHAWDMTRYSLMSRRRTPKAPPKPRRKDPHARTFDDVTGKARWGNDPVHDRFKRILDEGRE